MKNSIISCIGYFKALAIFFLIAGCSGPSKNECQSSIKALEDTVKSLREQITNSNSEKAVPISGEEYRSLMGNRYFCYNIYKNGNNVGLPKFIDPIMKVTDLINYAKIGDTSIFKGLRVYPGLTSNDEFVLIGCLGKDTISADEKEYRIFNKSDFTIPENPFPIKELDSPNNAKTLNPYYTNNMYINNKPQTVDNLSYRYSRFYYWKEIEALLKSNIKDFIWNDENSYKSYKIKLEIGYVIPEIAEIFHGVSPAWDKINHEGFTSIFHVVDPNGHDVIDPLARRNPANANDYKNLYLEVGHPCPPRCGALHPDNK